MSRLYPGHERRLRRLRMAGVLGGMAAGLVFVAEFLQDGIIGAPGWLWLLPLVSSLLLAVIAEVLLLAIFCELRQLRRQ